MKDVNPQPSGRAVRTSGTTGCGRKVAEQQRQVLAAWERFAAGDDEVRGVRAAVLLSWYRCRDVHRVSPHLSAAPVADTLNVHSWIQDAIFTKLGGAAGAAATLATMRGTLITVTDGTGSVLATWGARSSLQHGAESSLAPRFSWSERASGTNGMGTALECRGLARVHGVEHWCEGFHQWNCAGIAVHDPVTGSPLAALNVSRWNADLPEITSEWLRRTAADLESELRDQAIVHGRELVTALEHAKAKTSGILAALDTSGKVVLANDAARELLGLEDSTPAVDPTARHDLHDPSLTSAVEQAVQRAHKDADWSGITQLETVEGDEPLTAEIHPVWSGPEVLGMLLIGSEQPTGDRLMERHDSNASGPPRRVAAIRGSRIILLSPQEIRYAEADRHAVWFVTDQGRFRAATRGMDNMEQQLGNSEFLRVHRRYMVNIARVREIEQGFKGALTVSTTSREQEAIPVSRRRAVQLRQALGL